MSNDKEHMSPTLSDGDCRYTLDGTSGEVTLTGLDHEVPGAYKIPRRLGGCPVTGISERAFVLQSGLTSVTIPESVIHIEMGTFSSCDELTEIHVEKGNPRYRSIDGVLYDKEGLRLIRCPPGRPGAYSIPAGVREVADCAFSCCDALTDVALPASVRRIGDRAFTCCAGVKAFTVEAENPFFSSLDGTLFSKDGADLLQFPLGKAARYTVPAGVSRIARDAFRGTSVLTAIDVDEANAFFSGFDGVLYDKGRTRIVQVPTGIRGKVRVPRSVAAVCGFCFCTNLTDVVIESGVTGIAAGAFMDCVRLASVTLPDSVASIESHAFAGCRRLTGITLPDRLTRIEASLFSGCRHLATVVCGRNITEIGDYAFRNCRSLAGLPFLQGVSRIGEAAFYGCSSLKSMALPTGLVEIASDTFAHCAGIAAVTLPDGVMKIGSSAFDGCIKLTEVSIPDSVTCIEARAFAGCVSLPHVSLPKSIRRIEDSAFSSCSSLSKIDIPPGVTRLFSFTFSGCTGLQRIGLPASLIRIGFYAFIGNSSLSGLDVAEGNPLYRSVNGVLFDKKLTRLVKCPEGFSGSLVIPASVARLSRWCCESCSRLTEINVDGANPRYSSLDGVLYNKAQTALLIFPGGKTGRVVIPASVRLVSGRAFDGCAGVTEIVVDSANRHYRSVDGILYDREITTAVRCPEGKMGLEILPASVTHRADGSYRNCRGLSAVEADNANPCFSSLDGVLYDKHYTHLIGCPDMKRGVVRIPASVACVPAHAFSNCSGVTEIRVDDANPFLSSADGILFNKDRSRLLCCPWGKEGAARIPESVMDFENNAFSGCARLTAFDVAGDNSVYSSRDGLLLNKKMTTLILCPTGKSGRARIPASVDRINDGAFKGCDQLECVIIPEEATGIWSDRPSDWFSGEIRYEE